MENEIKDEQLDEKLTELDPPYESKEELMIGRLLDQYGIPFFYKQPTIVYNQNRNEIWKPTFTLLSYGGLVIDYIPNTGNDNANQIDIKRQIYKYNQIPATVLGPPDLDKPNWQKTLYDKLTQEKSQLREVPFYKGF